MEDQSILKPKAKWKPLFAATGEGLIHQIKLLFTPFGDVSPNTIRTIKFAQLILLFLIWSFIPIPYLPSISAIFAKGWDMVKTEGLLPQYAISLKTCLVSMFYATLLSSTITYLSTVPFFRGMCLLVTKGRFLSLMGLTFFFIVIFKGGDPLKDSLMVYSITVFFTDSFIAYINNIDETSFNHLKAMRMGPWETLWEGVIYGKIGELLIVMQGTFAMAWMSLTLVEGIVKQGGIGAMLALDDKNLRTDGIFFIAIVILSTGAALDWLIAYVRKTFCPWTVIGIRK